MNIKLSTVFALVFSGMGACFSSFWSYSSAARSRCFSTYKMGRMPALSPYTARYAWLLTSYHMPWPPS